MKTEHVTIQLTDIIFAINISTGPLNVNNCSAKWKYETNAMQVFSKLEIFIYQQDGFGNLVPDFYTFDARIVEKSMNLSIPVADLYFQEVAQGIQLLSFLVSEPGDFMLTVFDPKTSESISNMPYDYTVFVGMCKCSSLMCLDIPHIASGFNILAKDGDMFHCICSAEIRKQF